MFKNSIKLISFDAFGTLIKAKNVGKIYGEVASKYGVSAKESNIQVEFENLMKAVKYKRKDLSFWKDIITTTFANIGNKLPTNTDFNKFIVAFNSPNAYYVIHDSLNVVGLSIRHYNCPIVIITDSDDRFMKILPKMGFNADKIICTAGMNSGKSNIKSWQQWHSEFQSLNTFNYDEWLHVGDDLIVDSRIPKSLGIVTTAMPEYTSSLKKLTS